MYVFLFSIICIFIYELFSYIPFIPEDLSFPVLSFSSVWRTSFNVSCRAHLGGGYGLVSVPTVWGEVLSLMTSVLGDCLLSCRSLTVPLSFTSSSPSSCPAGALEWVYLYLSPLGFADMIKSENRCHQFASLKSLFSHYFSASFFAFSSDVLIGLPL